ncbi:MAG: hypothetical protein ACMXX7_00980 [Candidatus Woesearchaeota archaeon]
MEEFDITSIEDENQLEEIRSSNKKPNMAILNQRKLSKWEMDELFLEDTLEEF